MYCLAERHLSSIQKAIQSAHAIVTFGLNYHEMEEYRQWAEKDQTIVILDGGNVPDLHQTMYKLCTLGWPMAVFAEPDLGDVITAICFLADERIFDYATWGKSYEDYKKLPLTEENAATHNLDYSEWLAAIGGNKAEDVKELISNLHIAL